MDGAGQKGPARRRAKPDAEERIRDRNRALIRRAATGIFARKGFDGTRMAEIAEEAGLPKANVYYYFATKDDLYRAVLRQVLDGWTDALETLRADRDPFEAIGDYVRAKLDYSRQNPDESRVFATEIVGGARRLPPADRQFMQEVTRRHAVVLEGWMEAGRIRRLSARHLLISIWATTQYYSDFSTLAADALDREILSDRDYHDATETYTQMIIAGLRPRG